MAKAPRKWEVDLFDCSRNGSLARIMGGGGGGVGTGLRMKPEKGKVDDGIL